MREPETQDASGVQEWDIHLVYDILENLFGHPGDPALDVRAATSTRSTRCPTPAGSPKPHWGQAAVGRRRPSREARSTGAARATRRTVDGRARQAGRRPRRGSRHARSRGPDLVRLHSTPTAFRKRATGAILVANRIFWALGYWQTENHLVHVRPEQARDRPMTRRSRRLRASARRLKHSDMEAGVPPIASRRRRLVSRDCRRGACLGAVLGGFRYHGHAARRSERR